MRGKIKPLSLHPQSRNKRWFEKVTIAKQNDLVAQLVEQMTLNHWVESSSLSGVTKQSLKSGCFFYFCRPQAVAYLQHASARTGLWKSVVAPRRWTYRCGTVLSMSIKWRRQPPKGGCIIIAPGRQANPVLTCATALRRFPLRAASLYNSSSGVLEDNRRYYFYCV